MPIKHFLKHFSEFSDIFLKLSNMDEKQWSSKMLRIVDTLDSFHHEGASRLHCKPFIVNGKILGQVPPYVFEQLENLKDVFCVKVDCVELQKSLKTPEEITHKIQIAMECLRDKGSLCSLKGWRNEMYNVCESFHQQPLFKIERSAAGLFGIRQYGVHLNGYKRDHNNRLHMWIARRSLQKATFPGKLDQLAAGGIAAGNNIEQTLIKECQEEASIPESLAKQAVPAGVVSYCYEDERGIFPEVEFVYDLEVPVDFQPSVGDGEVKEFFCWPIDKVKEMIATEEFKPNCAIIILDFLIRHGIIHPDNEPNYMDFVTGIHRKLP